MSPDKNEVDDIDYGDDQEQQLENANGIHNHELQIMDMVDGNGSEEIRNEDIPDELPDSKKDQGFYQ